MSKYIGSPVVSLSTDTVDVTGDITTTDATPEVIIVNDTHEDTDGGREGKVTFKGQQSGGEETTLAQIQASHDGTSGDEKGDLIFKTNDGSDGASPTERMRIDSTGATTITTEGNEDTLTLVSTSANAFSGPTLSLYRNSSSPADADVIGVVAFNAENDADEVVNYSSLKGFISDASDGTEDGQLNINTMIGGTSRQRVKMDSTETVFNEEGIDLDFRVESNGNANMLMVDGNEDMVFIGKNATHEFDAYGTEIMMQLESSGTAPYAGFGMVQNSNDADSAPLIFGKSRGTSAAATTIVQDGDTLGRIEFQGMDGSDLETGASIFGQVDGTPGANDMPGRLVFNTTADGAHSATERMRITHEGNVQIGTTTDRPDNYNGSGSGTEISGLGLLRIARNGDMIVLNRVSTDGDVLNVSQDGSAVGQLRCEQGDITIGTGDVHLRFNDGADTIQPRGTDAAVRDNAIDLGSSSQRFDDIFATNGSINTSDENEKQDITSLTSAEISAATAISKLFKTFKWKDKVAAKGDNARTHTGVVAQQVQSAMSDAGLDASKYAFWCSDTWWETQTEVAAVEADEEKAIKAKDAYTRTDVYEIKDEAPEGATERTRMGVRYPELLAFIGAATEQRLTSIESRLTALEGE